MIDGNRLIELLEDEILRIDTESTPGCGNLYGRDASVMRNTLNYVIDLINEQPKVGEWIPVEERLPEEAGVYRVTCLYDDKVYRVKDDLFYSDRTWGYDNRNRKVIAWKPLEKPYRVPLENNSKGEPK